LRTRRGTFSGLHAGGAGIKRPLKGRSESEGFSFHAEKSAQFPARKSALKAKKKDKAICCSASWGPHFYDIGVLDNCNGNGRSFKVDFRRSCANDTGRLGKTLFTVKEMEGFEIAD
jgi:hypothetical protein